jgi:D-proline reductase (dithiol) PrdB
MAERVVPGVGELDIDQMRARLEEWKTSAAEPLARHDWKSAFLRYPTLDLRDMPPSWATPPVDLRHARLTLIGSAGIYANGQTPFDADHPLGDYTYRALASDTDLSATQIAHDHYDNASARGDRNSVFPLDRLRELSVAGEIGGLTEHVFAFMGYQPDYVTLMERFIPSLLDAVMKEQPDAALLVPV